jgi:hypothetical protein
MGDKPYLKQDRDRAIQFSTVLLKGSLEDFGDKIPRRMIVDCCFKAAVTESGLLSSQTFFLVLRSIMQKNTKPPSTPVRPVYFSLELGACMTYILFTFIQYAKKQLSLVFSSKNATKGLACRQINLLRFWFLLSCRKWKGLFLEFYWSRQQMEEGVTVCCLMIEGECLL